MATLEQEQILKSLFKNKLQKKDILSNKECSDMGLFGGCYASLDYDEDEEDEDEDEEEED
jgi:hypothetical protein